jgi:hypothetical protein
MAWNEHAKNDMQWKPIGPGTPAAASSASGKMSKKPDVKASREPEEGDTYGKKKATPKKAAPPAPAKKTAKGMGKRDSKYSK